MYLWKLHDRKIRFLDNWRIERDRARAMEFALKRTARMHSLIFNAAVAVVFREDDSRSSGKRTNGKTIDGGCLRELQKLINSSWRKKGELSGRYGMTLNFYKYCTVQDLYQRTISAVCSFI